MYPLTRFSLAHRGIALALLGALSVAFALGLPRVRTEFGYRVLLGGEHPSIQRLEDFIARFGGGLPIYVLWSCGPDHPCASALEPRSIAMAASLTEALSPIEGVIRVDGPANAALFVPTADGFAARRFFEDGRVADDHEALARRALGDRLWVGNLISEDATVGALIVQTSDTRSETELRVVDAVQETIRPFQDQGFEFHLVGDSVSAVLTGRELAASMDRVIPLLVAVLALVLFVLSRSLILTTLALGAMGVALVWTVGLLGWIGWPRDAMLEVLAPLILTVGICEGIHLLARYAEEQRPGISPHDAMLAAARDVALPCLATSLTTAAGLISFATSSLATFVRFGLISTFGVLACLLLTFTLLPAVAVSVPVPRHVAVTSNAWTTVLRAIVHFARARKEAILGVAGVLFLLSVIGWAAFLRVDTHWNELVGERSQSVRWITFMEERLRPTASVEIELTLPPDDRLSSPASLRAVQGLSEGLRTVEGLGTAYSVVDFTNRLNRLIHDDDAAFEGPADSEGGNAELLELLRLDDPRLLSNWMAIDGSRVRISVDAPEASNETRARMLESIRAHIGATVPSSWSVSLTGAVPMNFDWVRDIQSTQLRSFPSAAGLVFILTAWLLGSLRLGLAAMVPTLLPAVVVLGAMGWFGVSLDVGRTMIAAVLLGISVDESIHLLSFYKLRRAAGDDASRAMQEAVLHVGRAAVTTAVALGLGFLTLLASAWQTVSSFGFFLALSIAGSLVGTLFVLPALIFVMDRKRPGLATQEPPRRSDAARRAGLTIVAFLPVAAAFLATALPTRETVPLHEPACWILPNSHVMLAPGGGECPLRMTDRILAFLRPDGTRVDRREVADLLTMPGAVGSSLHTLILRDGRQRIEEIPIRPVTRLRRGLRVASAGLLAAALLCIPALVLRRAGSPAALPFALFYSAVSLVAIVMMAGRGLPWLVVPMMAAMLIVPATLVHFNFTFLREREIVRAVPGVAGIPYALAGLLLIVGWDALYRHPLLWPSLVYLVLASTVIALAVLLASCLYTLRGSASVLERARARTLLYGALFLPILPTALLAGRTETASELLASYLWISALVMPLPIGLAITRHGLFDLGWDVRRWVGRLVYLGTTALVATSVLAAIGALAGAPGPLRDPTFLFLVSFACVAVVEPIRGHLLGALESVLSPSLQRLRELRERFARECAELRDEGEVAHLLGETLSQGLCAEAGCVVLGLGESVRLGFSWGVRAPTQPELAVEAGALLGDRALLHLPLVTGSDEGPASRLEREGVEAIASIASGAEIHGLILLAGSRRGSPYTGPELDFLAMAASQAGVALANARLAETLLAHERHATAGRVAIALAHDLRKELDWLDRLVRRLPERLGDPPRLARDVSQIQGFTQGLTELVTRFVRDASDARFDAPGSARFESVVEGALEVMSRVHPRGQVTRSIDPALRGARVHGNLTRVLSNLIDNALRASPDHDTVHLFATSQGADVQVVVSDQGIGMTPEVVCRAFQRGFTTRTDGSGAGLGLSICREIVESLGGEIQIESTPGQGTRVSLRVPMAA